MNAQEINRRNNQWAKENADKILLLIPKGKKAEIQEYAKFKGKSVNAVLNELIETGIKQDFDYRANIFNKDTAGITMPWEMEG